MLRAGGLALIVCLVGGFVSQSLSYLVPSKMPYLLSAFGERSVVSGLFLGGFGVANIVGSLLSAPFQQRAKRSLVVSVCFAFLALGCLFMAIAQGKWLVLLSAVAIGLGVGCVTPLFLNWIASLSMRANSRKLMGSFAAAVNLGQFSCSLFSGAVLALFGTYSAVFFAGALVAVLAIACSLLLRSAINKD